MNTSEKHSFDVNRSFGDTILSILRREGKTSRITLSGGQVRISYQIRLEGGYAILATFAILSLDSFMLEQTT